MIEIPIEIGDIVRVGRFKNKRIKVKSIEYDAYGLPIINGRPLLTMRIEKLMPKQENIMKKSELISLIKEEIKSVLSERKASPAALESVKVLMDEFTKRKIIVVHKEKGSNKGYRMDKCMLYITPSSRFYKAGKKPKTLPEETSSLMPETTIVHEKYEANPDYNAPIVDLPGLWVTLGAVGRMAIINAKSSGFMIGGQYMVVDDVEKNKAQKKALEAGGPDRVYYKGGPTKMWWLRTWE